MQEKNYRELEGISQSMLKDFKFKSPLKWKKKYIDKKQDEEDDNSKFIFGSLTDTLLFTPEVLDERFFISDAVKKPSEEICKILENVYNNMGSLEDLPCDITLDMCRDEILQYASKWQSRWGADAKYNNIVKEGSDYFEFLKLAKGREIVTSTDNLDAIEIRDIVIKHPRTSKYLISTDEVEVLFQLEISVEIEGVVRKGAIDILVINHKNKTIRVIDFKTTMDAHNFVSSIKKFGYGFQLSYYNDLVNEWKKEKFPEYQMEVPLNIAIDRWEKIPYIYEHDENDMIIEKEGNAKKIGWMKYLEDLKWHIKNDIWETRELYENGKIKIKLYDQE